MSQGEWIIGRVGAALPPALLPFWRFALTFIFGLGALLLLALSPDAVLDYVRVFDLAMAAYICGLSGRIAQTNYHVRRSLVEAEDHGADMSIAKMLPTHIMLLAVGTITSVFLHCAVLISFYGSGTGALEGTFPWLVAGVFMIKILGLNIIWRFVLTRKEQETK